ncbi:amino acid adenylation domain-containing protein [Sorangium sp. So ce590]|uniref:amino acid adenylation domain-containing protein n=1 Tax=Sorangium sp. So ce590 TaxID=3133317 RepID=UPI003F60D07D
MSPSRLDSCFDESAARYPDRPAVHAAGAWVTYAALRDRKREIAGRLRARGLGGAGVTVGLLAEKGAEAYAGLLGIMESGNIYVPLSPRSPRARLATIVEEARLTALIVDGASAGAAVDLLATSARPPLVIPAEPGAPAIAGPGGALPGPPDDVPRRPGDPYAYLLFTSGSTGRPKGVGITHANGRALIDALAAEIQTTPDDRFTQFAELSFDFSIGELFLCWQAGGCVFVPSFHEALMPRSFIQRHRITVWSSVPTLANNLKVLRALRPGVFDSLRWSLFCGEALPSQLAEAWQAAAPSCRIVNLYGPTEVTVFATLYFYDPSAPPAAEIVPLGRPLAPVRTFIEPGSGELLLAGAQVAPGYWRDSAATARSFVTLAGDPGGLVWYRTGDRAGTDERSDLVFLGRCDDQVKVRGRRVELREIEGVLRRVTAVDLVAVVPIRAVSGLCEDVVAYVNRLDGTDDEVRARCRSYLPEYMVPRRIFVLAEFPLNESGKIDHRALAERAAEEVKR